MKDLVALLPDHDIESVLIGLFSRPEALGIRNITVDYFQHPNHDAGCRKAPQDMLRQQMHLYRYALVMFDRDGCGVDAPGSGHEIQKQVEANLRVAGWDDRVACVVIEPEIEAWVWSTSPHVEDILGWKSQKLPLRSWLMKQEWLRQGEAKPSDPKGAMEAALRAVRKAPSRQNFQRLAEKVSLKGCEDAAFQRLLAILREWFPREGAAS
jgi:hypothetical protein